MFARSAAKLVCCGFSVIFALRHHQTCRITSESAVSNFPVSNKPLKDSGTCSGVSLKPNISELALNKVKVRRRADLQCISVA